MRHFVLVHGAASGAWCWYKVASQLKLAGHRVTAVDLGATDLDPDGSDPIQDIYQYVQPLMDVLAALSPDEKVILVGHSHGGFCTSLAMESFPKKIAVSVFVTAFMPKPGTPPVYLLKEFFSRNNLLEASKNGKFPVRRDSQRRDDYLTQKLYQNCPLEDIELARMLPRPGRLFAEDLAMESMLTPEKCGSVDRVFVVAGDDKTLLVEFQRMMTSQYPPKDVKLIEGADHSAMLSKPRELCQCLQDIAESYH